MVKAKRTSTKATRTVTPRAAKKNPWSVEQLTTNPKSKLVDADLAALFADPQSWNVLDDNEKDELKSLLPEHIHYNDDGSIPQSFLRYDNDWRNGVRQFQTDLEAGRYDPEWQRQAAEAMEERAAGIFDSYKEEHFEEWWGQKQKLSYDVLAGNSTKMKLDVLVKAGLFRVRDVWSYARVFGKAKGDRVLVEKDAAVVMIENGALSFSIPPAQSKFSSSSNGEDVVTELVTGPQALSTKILEVDGRIKNPPNGNAWKDFRCKRNNQDMGSLFEIRQDYYEKQQTNAEKARLASKACVLPYFSHSPFFDATSNNATLTTQATYNPSMFHLIQTREGFEGHLRTMQGLEFMVAYGPAQNAQQQANGGSGGEDTGVWVIRKQNRRKTQGADDEVTILSSYFVVGENVYMAPSVGNVLGSRTLSTVTYLTKFLSTASTLPNFSPSLGYTYMPPAHNSPTSAPSTQLTQQSKEGTPVPDTQSQAKSTKAQSTSKPLSAGDYQTARLMAESFALSVRYGNEYMDENPLVGEPGAFILSKSHDLSQTQPQSQPQNRTPKASAPPTPRPKITAPPTTARKGSKGVEKSPTTPGTKDKSAKRRKSKAVGVTGAGVGTTTPT